MRPSSSFGQLGVPCFFFLCVVFLTLPYHVTSEATAKRTLPPRTELIEKVRLIMEEAGSYISPKITYDPTVWGITTLEDMKQNETLMTVPRFLFMDFRTIQSTPAGKYIVSFFPQKPGHTANLMITWITFTYFKELRDFYAQKDNKEDKCARLVRNIQEKREAIKNGKAIETLPTFSQELLRDCCWKLYFLTLSGDLYGLSTSNSEELKLLRGIISDGKLRDAYAREISDFTELRSLLKSKEDKAKFKGVVGELDETDESLDGTEWQDEEVLKAKMDPTRQRKQAEPKTPEEEVNLKKKKAKKELQRFTHPFSSTMTWQRYLQGLNIFFSRCFSDHDSDYVMIPYADLFNHRIGITNYTYNTPDYNSFDGTPKDFKALFTTFETVKKGSQVFIAYHVDWENSQLFQQYGFIDTTSKEFTKDILFKEDVAPLFRKWISDNVFIRPESSSDSSPTSSPSSASPSSSTPSTAPAKLSRKGKKSTKNEAQLGVSRQQAKI
eukprot:TRINITY_DN2999_c0_g4_i1.p1 TRINITY_DN2999_c0_g4~~TRINITY_DN2999_c0_g4_i1.p1  ORF type:complete len:518 (-),score=147.39 TRINITY_DN2999_c0_g4_i1:4-1491(-)